MKKTDRENAKIRKCNMKLYPNYVMLGYNLLFFFGINIMFLSETKGFSDSQILLSNTLLALFSIVLQLPVTLIISKIGNKNSIIIGNIMNVLWGILMILVTSFEGLILIQLIRAFAVAIKYISEGNIISHSIPNTSRRNNLYSNITKKGYQKYYIVLAVTTIMSGFLYEINPYIPIIMCIICSIFATLIAFNFTDIKYEKKRRNNEIYTLNKYYKELSKGLKFTLTSKRLLSLFLFTGIILGAIRLSSTYELAILQYIGMPAKMIGSFYALLSLVNGIFARDALKFNRKHRNKSLINILTQYSLAFIVIGCVTLLSVNNIAKAVIIIIISIILASLEGIFSILQKKYFNSFTTDKISPSINSVKNIVDNTFVIITTYVGSLTLMFYNIGVSIIIVGFFFVIIAILLYNFSKDKLGLKASEYGKNDIYVK